MDYNDTNFRQIVELTKEGFWMIDKERKTIYVNKALCNLLGYEFDEFVGKSPNEFADAENQKIFKNQMSQIENKEHRTYSIELRAKSGENIPTIFNATTVFNENNEPLHAFAMITDLRAEIAARKALELSNQRLQFSQNILHTILDTQENLVAVTDGSKIIHANNSFLKFFNIKSLDELSQEQCLCVWFALKLTFSSEDKRCNNWLKEIEQSGWRVDSRSEDLIRNFIVVANPYPLEEGLYVVTFNDVTKLQQEKEYLVHLASTDTLTSLHNRAKLNDMLEFLIKKSTRYPANPFCIVMFDIDYFKNVNDTYGHQMGDEILKELASLVSSSIRSSDFIARYGGEEFVILTPNTDLHNTVILTEKLRQLIEITPFEGISLSCSFGIYQFQKGDTPSSLIEHSDRLLYKAKESGRNCIKY